MEKLKADALQMWSRAPMWAKVAVSSVGATLAATSVYKVRHYYVYFTLFADLHYVKKQNHWKQNPNAFVEG